MNPTNILVISSDQHNKFITGCYGNEFVQTPNIDRLANLGTRFDNAYTPSPICMPARAALATGRYCHQIGAWDNGAPYLGPDENGVGPESWGHRLTEQGFEAVTVGKLHFHPEGNSGYDERIPLHAPLAKDGYVGATLSWQRGEMPITSKLRQEVETAHVGEFGYTRYDREIAAASAKWLHEEAPRDKPWSAFVSFTYPHYPFIAPQEYVDLYDPAALPLPPNWQEADWSTHPEMRWYRQIFQFDEGFTEAQLRSVIAIYYGMVTFVDAQIGIVLDALERSGQWENTHIIYTSDHGEMLGEQGVFFKCLMHESSAGIPLILAGPDVPANHVCETPTNLIDVYPTVLQAVGAKQNDVDQELPGESLLEIANRPNDPERISFSEFHSLGSRTATFMVRNGNYKYVYYHGQRPQLFNLDSDPHEANDLAAAHLEDGAQISDDVQNVLEQCDAELRAILDPTAVHAKCRTFQETETERHGGIEKLNESAGNQPYSLAPKQFQ